MRTLREVSGAYLEHSGETFTSECRPSVRDDSMSAQTRGA
jgi:hypothetical protein